MIYSALRSSIFGNAFFEKYLEIENENSELKFSVRMLELQLSTLKKKNEELIRKNLDVFGHFKSEIVQLVTEQLMVSTRLWRILEMFKDM